MSALADASTQAPHQALALADELVAAWGSWGPTLSPHAERMAFLSDRTGVPQVWVQDLRLDGTYDEPTPVVLSDDPVVGVTWSADGAWLACVVATGGGVRTQVWVVRPTGTDARRIAGSEAVHAELGPWTRSGHRVAVVIPDPDLGRSRCHLADPVTGELHPLAEGDLLSVLDMSADEQLVILRDGQRGKQFCVVVDRVADDDHPLLPYPATGATETAIIRPAPASDPHPLVAYVSTDAGLPRRQLVAVPLGSKGRRIAAGVLAARDDAELEGLDADDDGRQLLLVWNVAGRSELELFDTVTDQRRELPGLPGAVVSDIILSRDGRRVIMSVEGPQRPREIWCLSTRTLQWIRVAGVPRLPEQELIEPELVRFRAHDGLELTGWLYRADSDGDAPGPAMLSLHGGPEAQERPVFSAQHQVLAAAGITVLAPNIRGSSGFGRAFVHADDVHGRRDAFEDVVTCADWLVSSGIADRSRIAITGRSYGGYLTLAGLAFYPGAFAAGVDICGMSDLHTFYRDTEPWIAAAAVSKYGDPDRDAALLAALSPLHAAANIDVPLLVVHGELDTNVPIGEAHQIVAALRELDRPVEYLQLDGEGHEYRRADSRLLLIRRLTDFLVDALGVS